MIVAWPQNFQNFRWFVCLWDLPLDFLVTHYPFSQLHLCCGGSKLADCFWRFSDWFKKVLLVEISRDGFDKSFVVFSVIFRHLMLSVICVSCRVLSSRKLSWLLVNFYPLLWIFSLQNLLSIGSHSLWQQLEETSLLCGLKALFCRPRSRDLSCPIADLTLIGCSTSFSMHRNRTSYLSLASRVVSTNFLIVFY